MFPKKLLLSMLAWLCCLLTTAYPQEEQQNEGTETPATIVLQTGKSTPPAFLYSASVTSTATVDSSTVKQSFKLEIRAVQGKWGSVSLGIAGVGEITNVIGGGITSWAVRVAGEERFLDLQIQSEAKEILAEVIASSPIASLPSTIDLLHMKPSKALGFDSRVKIDFDRSITGKVLVADGFSPLVSQERSVELQRFQLPLQYLNQEFVILAN